MNNKMLCFDKYSTAQDAIDRLTDIMVYNDYDGNEIYYKLLLDKIQQAVDDYNMLRWLIENTVPNTPEESAE